MDDSHSCYFPNWWLIALQMLFKIELDCGSIQVDIETKQWKARRFQADQNQKQTEQRQQGHPYEHSVQEQSSSWNAAGDQTG